MSITRPASTLTALIILSALLVPGFASALTKFENPLSPVDNPFIAINNFIDALIVFILAFAAAVALASLIYGGLRLILGASLSESEIARAKQIVFWAIIGLVVIGMAGAILAAVRSVLGLDPPGSSAYMDPYSMMLGFLAPTAHAGFFDAGLNITIGKARGLFGLSSLSFDGLATAIGTFLTGLVAALALVAIVWGGVMYILSLGDESRSARAKHIILYAILGLLVAGLTNLILFTICGIGGFQASVICSGISSSFTFFTVILNIANVLLAPAGAIAFVALIYGGYLYMTSGGDESRASRAKHTILYALLGLAVIGIAGIVVNVVIGLLP